MPVPYKHEKRSGYMKRAVPMIMAEGGHTQKQAVGKAEGMYDYYSKKKERAPKRITIKNVS